MTNRMNRDCQTVRKGPQGNLYYPGQLTGKENLQQTLDFVNHQQAIANKMGKEAYLRMLLRKTP